MRSSPTRSLPMATRYGTSHYVTVATEEGRGPHVPALTSVEIPDDPHALDVQSACRSLRTDPTRGLSRAEAALRARRWGRNELRPPPREGIALKVVRHLTEPMSILLVVAAVVSGTALGEAPEAIAIGAIVVLNAAIAVIQESRAQDALDALRDLETRVARVVRDGAVGEVDASGLVPGDVVLLGEGDRVPADVRLSEAADVRIDESSLTGESLPVRKRAEDVLPADTPVADRRNMAFAGTLVTSGSGRAVVTATGASSEIGKIAESLAVKKQTTPLQRELGALTTRLGVLAVLAAGATFVFSWFFRPGTTALQESFLAAVALAVAAVPEGLATVVAVALAVGVKKMAGHGAIVRWMPAVETLGSTSVIATDKTGTLTRNELEVMDVWAAGGRDEVEIVGALCNDATLDPPTGDPLEVALLRWIGAERAAGLRDRFDVVERRPFDSTRKRMSVVATDGSRRVLLVKGAPEAVAPDGAADLQARVAAFARRGLKVLALARRDDEPFEEEGLSVVGLVGLGDPLRPEARAACEGASRAGIRVVMVTGDHPDTARAIAASAGLGDTVVTGRELDATGFPEAPERVDVYARVTPRQKIELVDALKARGEVVAVTGDGVNDAPALHGAHIGVAMGRAGTDVAKEAADLVITDDNLATIVTAIREGRGIYDNIRKVVEYLVAANLAEVITVLACMLLFPEPAVPLLPLQLLWINFVTDGLPAIGLGLDRGGSELMARPPRRIDDSLVGRARVMRLLRRGSLLAAGSIGAFAVSNLIWGEPPTHARALMFTTLAFAQLAYAMVVRGRWDTSNGWLVAGLVGGIALQIVLMMWAPLRELFGSAWLTPREWLLAATGAVAPSLAIAFLEGHGPHKS